MWYTIPIVRDESKWWTNSLDVHCVLPYYNLFISHHMHIPYAHHSNELTSGWSWQWASTIRSHRQHSQNSIHYEGNLLHEKNTREEGYSPMTVMMHMSQSNYILQFQTQCEIGGLVAVPYRSWYTPNSSGSNHKSTHTISPLSLTTGKRNLHTWHQWCKTNCVKEQNQHEETSVKSPSLRNGTEDFIHQWTVTMGLAIIQL